MKILQNPLIYLNISSKYYFLKKKKMFEQAQSIILTFYLHDKQNVNKTFFSFIVFHRMRKNINAPIILSNSSYFTIYLISTSFSYNVLEVLLRNLFILKEQGKSSGIQYGRSIQPIYLIFKTKGIEICHRTTWGLL